MAGIIISDPVKYNSALLGRENSQYVDWILKVESWGGKQKDNWLSHIATVLVFVYFCLVHTEMDMLNVML